MKAAIAAFFIATLLIYSGLGITFRIYLPYIDNSPPTYPTALGTPASIERTPTPQ